VQSQTKIYPYQNQNQEDENTKTQKQTPPGFTLSPQEISEHFEKMSASSLERLIKCPYRFLLSKFNLKALEIPSSYFPDNASEGTWLHKVLSSLFENWPEEKIKTIHEFKSYLISRLNELTIKYGPKDIEKSRLFLHLSEFSWPKLVNDHLAFIYEHNFNTSPSRIKTELPLGEKYSG
jgi:ATP-dependent helicase/DNAse subunit B